MKGQCKKFYITTAIDYANATPHIGHALEKVQADVLARYHRQRGEDVWFLTGTDEHGAKIARAAEAAGKTPQDFVDENAAAFRRLKQALNLSWDDFIRTSDRVRHWPGAEKIWRAIAASGDLYQKKYRGLYCVGHEAFVTEKDLTDGKCRDHQKEPEVIEEENWFFRLSRYTEPIRSAIHGGVLKIMPESRKNEILALLNDGLEDVSFSRPSKDISWGIPVPDDPTQTMYVWSDALSNYLTAIGYGNEQNKNSDAPQFFDLWPADVHLIGKDILRFHAAIWPGMLLSAGLPLPRAIFVHGFLTVGGQKMSKTVGNVIDPVALTQKYGVDPVRYYLLREIPSGDDGDFSEAKLMQRYNGELANGLGNFVARVVTLAQKLDIIQDSVSSAEGEQGIIQNQKLQAECADVNLRYIDAMENFRLNEALEHIWRLVRVGDQCVNDERPWESDKPRVIADLLHLIIQIACLLEPFLPETAEKIQQQIRFESETFYIEKGANLFPRLTTSP
ncbi:MAG: methionine--tRNA ligase [Patescibacteria group bacterium]